MFEIRFPLFIVISFLAFVAIVRFVLRERAGKDLKRPLVVIGLIVVVGGMVFAKFGQNTGLPWWIYYTLPMFLTVFLPPIYFKMNRRETPRYLMLSFLSAPLIHLFFSFFIGWKDYMPFVEIPSLWELI